MKSSRYGLLTKLALLVECLATGQNCITYIICIKGKSVKENKEYSSLILISYMATL